MSENNINVITKEFPNSEIVMFTSDNGSIEFRADIDNGTMWGTRTQIANLFDTTQQNITIHIGNIYKDGELEEMSTRKDSLLVQKELNREVERSVVLYNLDVIIAVGYRVNSKEATKFRIWATTILRDYLVKGYNLNKYSLKNSDEKFDDLHEAITFMESKKDGEEIRGKMTIKLTKNLVRN